MRRAAVTTALAEIRAVNLKAKMMAGGESLILNLMRNMTTLVTTSSWRAAKIFCRFSTWCDLWRVTT